MDRLKFLSPAVLLQDALNDIAGTGAARHRHFMGQVDAFHRGWRAYFTSLIFQKAQFTAVDEAPRFTFREEATGAVAGRVALALAGLAAPAAIIAWAGFRRMRRYPIVGR